MREKLEKLIQEPAGVLSVVIVASLITLAGITEGVRVALEYLKEEVKSQGEVVKSQGAHIDVLERTVAEAKLRGALPSAVAQDGGAGRKSANQLSAAPTTPSRGQLVGVHGGKASGPHKHGPHHNAHPKTLEAQVRDLTKNNQILQKKVEHLEALLRQPVPVT